MKQIEKLLIFAFLVIGFWSFWPALSSANDLMITNVRLQERDVFTTSAKTLVVEFDVSWKNAFNLPQTTPYSHTLRDGVWLFLKLCKCSNATCMHSRDCTNSKFYHLPLESSGTNPDWGGSDYSNHYSLEVPQDLVGALLHMANEGTQVTFQATDVRLKADLQRAGIALNATDAIRVKVFGLEMVYVDTGYFSIGDGDGSQESTAAFHTGTGNSYVLINTTLKSNVRVDNVAGDDAQLTDLGLGIDGDGGLDLDNSGSIGAGDNPDFPVGYNAFWAMKYELTQGQYRDFLNTLSQAEQANRVHPTVKSRITGETAAGYYVMSNSTSVQYRQGVRAGSNPANNVPYVLGCDLDGDGTFDEADDGEGIAMNYLRYQDLAAYADWAGLRLLTETEFEKLARGAGTPVKSEFPWGTASHIGNVTSVSYAGTADEVSNYTSGYAMTNWQQAPTGYGNPIRVGFASAASGGGTRTLAAGGYYGAMELAGNVAEIYISIGDSYGRLFDGTHGDGKLATASGYEGNATCESGSLGEDSNRPLKWPGCHSGSQSINSGDDGVGLRGGHFSITSGTNAEWYCSVSERSFGRASCDTNVYFQGGRLGRTAP